jgi:hypothetical protein
VSVETFTTVCVPGIASLAYFSAGVANLYVRNYALAVMWLCYSIANICLLSTVLRK